MTWANSDKTGHATEAPRYPRAHDGFYKLRDPAMDEHLAALDTARGRPLIEPWRGSSRLSLSAGFGLLVKALADGLRDLKERWL